MRDLLDVYTFDKLGSFFNISTTRNYIARLCPTAAPASCHGGHQGVVASSFQTSSNVRPLRAQNTAECIVLCLAHVEASPMDLTTNNFRSRPQLGELKLVSYKTAAVHQPSKVSWTQLSQLLQSKLVGILAGQYWR